MSVWLCVSFVFRAGCGETIRAKESCGRRVSDFGRAPANCHIPRIGAISAAKPGEGKLGFASVLSCDDVDYAAHGIRAVKCALWTAEDLDAVYIFDEWKTHVKRTGRSDGIVDLCSIDHDEGVLRVCAPDKNSRLCAGGTILRAGEPDCALENLENSRFPCFRYVLGGDNSHGACHFF